MGYATMRVCQRAEGTPQPLKRKKLHSNIGENGITMDDIMIHDETTEDTGIHMMLARMSGDLPVAIGVIRNVKKTSYTQLYEDQMEEQMANGKYKCVDDLLNSGDTWEI